MKTTEFDSQASAAQLNESMFKKFGVKVNFDKYTREELENYRNLVRTNISQHESQTNFNDLLTDESYQKNKHLVNLLNQKIKEMLGESAQKDKKMKTTEGKKVDRTGDGKKNFDDVQVARMTAGGVPKKKAIAKATSDNMKEGFPTVADAKARAEKEKTTGKFDKKPNKETGGTIYTRKSSTFDNGTEDKPKNKKVKEGLPMVKGPKGKMVPAFAADGKGKKDLKKKKMDEARATFRNHVRVVNENLAILLQEDEEGKAKAITAASDMVNDFTTWMQRVGQYQTKSMIELADSIRGEFGQAESEAFKQAVAPALAATIETLTAQREAISQAVAVLAGEATQSVPMGAGPAEPEGMDGMDVAEPDTMNAGGDEFGASDAAAGGPEAAGRALRESRLRAAHSIMRTLSK